MGRRWRTAAIALLKAQRHRRGPPGAELIPDIKAAAEPVDGFVEGGGDAERP
jgi:hypothetical protein